MPPSDERAIQALRFGTLSESRRIEETTGQPLAPGGCCAGKLGVAARGEPAGAGDCTISNPLGAVLASAL